MGGQVKTIIASSLVVVSLLMGANAANAAPCKTYNFNKLFYSDYSETIWVNPGEQRTITWTVNANKIHKEKITRKMKAKEVAWTREAISSWDDALSSITFLETDAEEADLVIGLVKLNKPRAVGFWNAWWVDDVRYKATIRIKSSSDFVKNKNGFIHIMQHEVGNVLGLGDIKPRNSIRSVQEDPLPYAYKTSKLSKFDRDIIQQLYGERVCTASN